MSSYTSMTFRFPLFDSKTKDIAFRDAFEFLKQKGSGYLCAKHNTFTVYPIDHKITVEDGRVVYFKREE